MSKYGSWKITEDQLRLYDRSGNLFKELSISINDKESLSNFDGILDNFNSETVCPGDEGINKAFKSQKDKEIEKEELEYTKNYCNICDRKLKRTVYKYEGKFICPYCYKKKDTFINNIVKVKSNS